MEELLRRNNLKIIDFFHRVEVGEVPTEEILPFDPDLKAFLNINTPEDLKKIHEPISPRFDPTRNRE